MSVMARNTLDDIFVLCADRVGQDFVKWEPYGDPNGEDVQEVVESVLNDRMYQRAVRRGQLEVVTDQAEIDEINARSDRAWETLRTQATSVDLGGEEHVYGGGRNGANTSNLQKADPTGGNVCVGPNEQGSQYLCQRPVSQSVTDYGVKPPLCATHKHLSDTFIAAPTGMKIAGRDEVKWSRIELPVKKRRAPRKQEG